MFYFEEKNRLKEISNNIDFDLWEKAFRSILNGILTRKGIFPKNNSINPSESKISKN